MTSSRKLECQCQLEYGDTIPDDIVLTNDGKSILTNSLGESVYEDVWRNQNNIIKVKVMNKELVHLRGGVKIKEYFNDVDVGYIPDINGNLVIRSNFRVNNKTIGIEGNVSRVLYKCKAHKNLSDNDLIKELHKPQTPKPIDPKIERKNNLKEKLDDDSITFEELKEYLRN